MVKVCRTCKEHKEESNFSIAYSGKQFSNFRSRVKALKSQCKSCDAVYAREFRKNNTNYKGSGKNTKYENRLLSSAVSTRLLEAKSRASKRTLAFDIDKDFLMNLFIIQKGLCAISKETLLIEPKQFHSLSLDKIDPNQGYIKTNVQWVSWIVYRAKGDMSQDMFINMCKTITEKSND